MPVREAWRNTHKANLLRIQIRGPKPTPFPPNRFSDKIFISEVGNALLVRKKYRVS
jgi:hypothetical protein